MKHYKDSKNNVYAYESDGSQDAFIADGLTLISDEEALLLTASPPAPALTNSQIEYMRQMAYQSESDPLFFKAQRGEANSEEWLAKITEIKARYPLNSQA